MVTPKHQLLERGNGWTASAKADRLLDELEEGPSGLDRAATLDLPERDEHDGLAQATPPPRRRR